MQVIYIAYGKSAMDAKNQLKIFKGRPFGGIAVFVRKSFSNLVSVVGSDDDNRIICVRFACRDLGLLMFGSHFSCCDSSSLYIDNLLKILGYIESIICLLYTSPSPRDRQKSRMPSSA